MATKTSSVLGPITTVSIAPGITLFSGRCGYETFYEVGVLGTFLADVVLAIFQGLDAIDRGTNAPWLQFGYSAGLSIVYSILLVIAYAMYRKERVVRFRYRWVISMLLSTVIMWTTFGIFASWIGWFGGDSNVSPSEGAAFTTWIAINAAAVVLFMLRFISIMLGLALLYTYLRIVELVAFGTLAGGANMSLPDYLFAMQTPAPGPPMPEFIDAVKTAPRSTSSIFPIHPGKIAETSYRHAIAPGTVAATKIQQQQRQHHYQQHRLRRPLSTNHFSDRL